MSEENLDDFQKRIERIAEARRVVPQRVAAAPVPDDPKDSDRNRIVVGAKVVGMVLVALLGMKGLIHAEVGTKTYEARRIELENGGIVDQLSAALMVEDPVTMLISSAFRGSEDAAIAAGGDVMDNPVSNMMAGKNKRTGAMATDATDTGAWNFGQGSGARQKAPQQAHLSVAPNAAGANPGGTSPVRVLTLSASPGDSNIIGRTHVSE